MNERDVVEMKRLKRSGVEVNKIARQFAVSRTTIWKLTRDLERRVECLQCGTLFSAKTPHSKFCSTRCRVGHWRSNLC